MKRSSKFFVLAAIALANLFPTKCAFAQKWNLNGVELGKFVPDGVAFVIARKLDGTRFVIRVETHWQKGTILQSEDCYLDGLVWSTANEDIWQNVPHYTTTYHLGGRYVRAHTPFILRVVGKTKEQQDGDFPA